MVHISTILFDLTLIFPKFSEVAMSPGALCVTPSHKRAFKFNLSRGMSRLATHMRQQHRVGVLFRTPRAGVDAESEGGGSFQCTAAS